MARVQITKSDRFEEWRVKDNQVAATVGNVDSLVPFTSVTFTGIVGSNLPEFVGTPSTFNITRDFELGYTIQIINQGSDYVVNDTISVLGSQLGGTDGINDALITITEIGGSGEIIDATITGTPNYELVDEVNQIRSEMGNSVDHELTTTAQTLYEAVNELDSKQGNVNLTTTAQTVTGAIVELDTLQGNVDITSISVDNNTVTGALSQLHTELGSTVFTAQGTSSNALVTYVDLGDDHTVAINSLKTQADFLADELGGVVADDYSGPDTNVISALNALYGASSISTLDNVYLRRDGTTDMTGVLKLSNLGIDSQSNDFLLKTGGSTRMTVNSSGSFGIGRAPSTYKLDVQGSANASTLRYSGQDTDIRYLRTDGNDDQVETTVEFIGSTTINPGPSKSFAIGQTVVATDTLTITEWVEDVIGSCFTGNSLIGGISSTYDDTTGKVSLAVANNAHSHVHTNISDWTEAVQDTVGGMLSGNTESGIVVTYDDPSGKINLDVNDPVLTFTGGATGSGTITNLGNTSIALTLDRDSVQDLVGQMLQGNTETGIDVTYDDANNEIDFALSASPVVNLTGDATGSVTLTNLGSNTFNLPVTIGDNSHNHTFSNITDGVESVQDIVGNMVATPNVEAGIAVDYDDTNGKLSFNVIDPTIQLSGDVVGQAVMTNLGSVNISTSIANDSHTHDGRYYTEAEADTRFINNTSDTMSGTLTVQGDLYVGKNGGGDSRIFLYDDNSDTWRHLMWDDSANTLVIEDNSNTNRTIMHSGNIGSQSVTNATNATDATNSSYTYVSRTDSTNSTYYVNFSSIGNGNQRIRNDAGMTYNPATNTISTGTFSGRATTANYADLAEKYLADAEYEVGTVIAVGGEKEVTAASADNAHSVLGVVSENPAYLMNDKLEDGTAVALKGRVPVKVIGEVQKGDRLAPSTQPGFAEVNNDRNAWSFAIALESGSGTVEAVIL